ncbi:MAG: hypothetical protein FWG42_10585 [Clostridiales bacterium]|nr:hypothetical protein [Clostridiales bacterium]
MKKKRLFTVALICLMAFALFIGCGGGEDDGRNAVENETSIAGNAGAEEDTAEGGLSAKEIVSLSAGAMAEFDSYRGDVVMNMDMEANGEAAVIKIDIEMDVFTNPYKVKMKMKMEPQVEGFGDIESYVISEGSNLVTYINALGAWYKRTQPFSEEPLGQYSMAQYTGMLDDTLKHAEIVAQEAVNGIPCWKIAVTVNMSTMMDIMAGLMGESLGGLVPSEMFDRFGDTITTVWISQDDYCQIKLDMNMAEMLNSLFKDAGEDIAVTEYNFSVTTTDFNNIADFTLPEDAKLAAELPSDDTL